MSEKLKKIINEAQAAEEGFSRDLSCKVYRTGRGVLSVSRLADHFHDFTFTMLIDPSKFTILEAHVEMTKAPYEICRKTIEDVENLCGIFIFHPAVNREVRRAINRKDGCTHLFELIEFTLQTLFTGGPRAGINADQIAQIDKELHPEEHRRLQISNPRLRNTCRAFVLDD